jgi:hypothetical protein
MAMYTAQTLQIVGYRDAAVPHTFLRQEAETGHLALLLPGIAYTCDNPLLYYPGRLLLDKGTDLLRVEYAYNKNEQYGAASQAEQGQWLDADVTAAYRAAVAQRPYERITLVGKSLGTLAMSHLLATEDGLAGATAVWLTPLLRFEQPRRQIARWGRGGRSLFVIGSADPYYDAAGLAEVEQATGGQSLVIEGADHSLEISGDTARSLEALQRVIQAIQEFIG